MVANFNPRLNRIQMLSIQEEKILTAQYKANPTKTLADKIIMSNWRYVAKVAHTYSKRYKMDAYELFQEGLDGMMVALGKFDPEKCYNYPKARFSSYAKMWVIRKMQIFIVKNWSVISHNRLEAYKLLFWKFDGQMTPADRWPNKDVSMDAGIDDENKDLNLNGLFCKEEDQPDVQYTAEAGKAELLTQINKILEAFNERDQTIIKERIMAEDPLTLQAIADRMGVSRERIRQVETRVMEKLSTLAESLNLKEYY